MEEQCKLGKACVVWEVDEPISPYNFKQPNLGR
jgi:hypothetical protein